MSTQAGTPFVFRQVRCPACTARQFDADVRVGAVRIRCRVCKADLELNAGELKVLSLTIAR